MSRGDIQKLGHWKVKPPLSLCVFFVFGDFTKVLPCKCRWDLRSRAVHIPVCILGRFGVSVTGIPAGLQSLPHITHITHIIPVYAKVARLPPSILGPNKPLMISGASGKHCVVIALGWEHTGWIRPSWEHSEYVLYPTQAGHGHNQKRGNINTKRHRRHKPPPADTLDLFYLFEFISYQRNTITPLPDASTNACFIQTQNQRPQKNQDIECPHGSCGENSHQRQHASFVFFVISPRH